MSTLFSFVGCAALLEVDEDPIVKGADAGSSTEASTSDNAVPAANRKRVFVTKEKYNGDLQSRGQSTTGSGGADALCNEAAASAKLGGGPWNAWIRDGDTLSEADRVRGIGPWYLVDRETLIFEGPAKLRLPNSSPVNPLDLDETSNRVASTERAWTASRRGLSCSTCVGFKETTGDNGGGYGQVGALSNAWTDSGCQQCTAEAHLYCFEE